MARVLIVGAGPGGAALAFVLAQRGIGVTLLERQHGFDREFRGEVLMPSGQQALGQMGLKDRLDALPQRRVRFLRVYRHARPALRVDLATLGGGIGQALIVSQPAMLEMLLEQACLAADFEFRSGCGARELIVERGRVVGVIAGQPPRELRADLVVGADGRASTIRKLAGLPEERQPQAFDVVWCKVPMPTTFDFGDAVRVYLSQGHAALAFPTYGDRIQVGWLIDKGTIGALRRRGVEEWTDELAGHVDPEFAAHLRQSRRAVTHPFLLDVVCGCASSWTAPGLLLLGDAAHPMSPVGGQGINLALRDAIVAANHLVPALRGGAAHERLDAATRAFEAERMPEVRRVQRLQQYPPGLIFGRWPLSGAILSTLALLGRAGLLGPMSRVVVARFARGVTDVRLRV